MSTSKMENLYESQLEITDAMQKLKTNLKKDGADRKTEDYFKRRLELLESYWLDYQNNHMRICAYGVKEHTYFKNSEHEVVSALYISIKTLISEQRSVLAAKETPPTPVRRTQEKQEEQLEQIEPGPSTKPVMESRGSTSKLDDMIRKQAANIKAFKRAMSNVDLDAINEKWELEDALKTIQSKWNQVDTLHWEIDGEMCGVDEEYDLVYNMNEKTFINLKRGINKKLSSVSHRELSTPQMDIPVFTGKYHQWYSFKDLFNEAIHNNISLSNAQKMQFLKGKLRGEAEKIIQHLPISASNYNTCWELLNHRYNNKKLIFTSIINTLLGLPSMQQQSLVQIKKLHDVTMESLHAIKNLGVDISTWDPLFVHLLSQKLDSETFADYIDSLKNARELPVLQEFLDYLESKFTSLETSRRKQEHSTSKSNHDTKTSGSKNHSSYHNQHSNNNLKSFNKALHVSSAFKCLYCGQQHGLYNCKKFLELTNENKLKTVAKLKVCMNCLFDHNGQQCISTKRCRKCDGMHNTIMHDACMKPRSIPANNAITSNVHQSNENSSSMSISSHVASSVSETNEVMLATALIKVMAVDGSHQILRALIDPGSQVSLIKESAVKKLGLQKSRCNGVIIGIGEQQNNCKGKLTIHCISNYNDFSFSTDALIMNSLLGHLPSKSVDRPNWSHIENLKLADPEFYMSRPVDLLLNANVHGIILLSGLIKGENPSQPVVKQTQLGWIIYGGGEMTSYRCNVVLNNIQDIQRFWDIEDISEESTLSAEDQECIDYYLATTKRRGDGRYEVKLPIKSDINEKLGSSKEMALAQFQSLERKFKKQPTLAEQYTSFIHEYQALGHMVPSQCNNNQTISCYLPHHAVQRSESATTKLRVVFNASAKTSSGYSLNDFMFKGPNLQQDLQGLIIKWRQYQYAYTADIEKMYRQIMVNETDQPYQQIVWRDSPHQPIRSYQLATVTYGTKSAPFLAMMTLRQLAKDEQNRYPKAAKVLTESFYVDDLIHGSHCIENGKQLISDLNKLLKSGGFKLRKWSANHSELLANINYIDSDGEIIFNFKSESTSKTLGLRWNSVDDQFTFKYNLEKQVTKLTKRTLLSEISKLFDPLGWIAPVSTKLKLLFQNLWVNNMLWDEEVSENVSREWEAMRTDIENINEVKIPRWIGYQPHNVIELHGYCDASTKAYAAVIYARIKNQNESSIVLVVAKSRLAPISKNISLPRLELSGAHLLGRLMKKVISCLSEQKLRVFGWTDSMVVLGWLQGDPGRWKPFVANRTKSISEIIKPECWRYVKSEENPADAASRGISASQLKNHPLWWQGPSSLKAFDENLESKKQKKFATDQEMKAKYVQGQQANASTQNQKSESIIMKILENHSSFSKITKIVAWTLRATKTIQLTNQATSATYKTLPSYVTLRELQNAKSLIIKYVQRTFLGQDIEYLKQHGKLNSKSNLLKLNPFIDREGILRVGGRLGKAEIGMEMKHPAIIPHNSRLTLLLINQAHLLTYHGGPRLTLANLRLKYWILGGNQAVKKELKNCVTCRKHTPKIQPQLMGDLPEARSNPAHPFYNTGVDYTGYVEVKSSKGRGIRSSKGYIAIFVCMVTKAVHLELVSDLSSSAFLAALRRMAARRGAPRHIYSDNGTNFVGANRILQEQFHDLKSIFDDNFLAELTELNIEWHFNAPSWPSAGGLWERAVRSLKHHLKRVVGEQKLTFEEYTTVLAQLEACLNSRPLCALSEDIDDLEILTPAHFLIGRPGTTIIETEHDARTRWTLSAKISHDIWKKWKSEYLTQMSVRSKWTKPSENIKIGQLVTIQDDNLPPGKWMMGRVLELHPGQDGFVRVVTLKTKNGIIKRPIVKLSILSMLPSSEENINEKQDIIKEEQAKLKRSKPQTMFASLALALIFFMSLLTTSQAAFSISALPRNMSLYFDSIHNMQVVRDKWTLIVYYNMSPYWDGMATTTKFLNYLDKTCSALPDTSRCNMILVQLHHEYSELQHYNRLLLNQHFDARARQRRGLINGVGYIANSLFGVLDQSFAEQYKRDIQLTRQNEHHINNLLKNQTSIIEAEYNVLKRAEQNIQIQHKSINKHLNELDRATNTIKQTVERLSEIQDFTLSALTAVNLLQNLKRIQETLLDTITDIYHAKFNSHLLTPDQLKNELQFISGQLTKDVTLPVDNIQSDLKLLYGMLRVKARVMTDYVIFEIIFPLSSRDSYEIYKILPVPHQIGGDMLNVIPKAEYIAINVRKDAYLTISSMELQQCIHNENAYLCTIDKPVNYLPIDEKFCKINSINQCIISKSQCKDMWVELNDPSKYLYFCCNTYSVRIICQEQVTYQQVTGAGIINLQPKCIIKGKDFALFSRSHSKNTIKSNPDIETPQITELNHFINISLSHYMDSANPLNSTMEDLGEQVNQLRANMANTSDDEDVNLSSHDIHQYAICYGLLGAAIIAAAAFLWRRRSSTRRSSHIAEPSVKFSSTQDAVERQPTDTTPSEVNIVKFTRKQSMADRQSSDVNFVASTYSLNNLQERATSPIPQKRNSFGENS